MHITKNLIYIKKKKIKLRKKKYLYILYVYIAHNKVKFVVFMNIFKERLRTLHIVLYQRDAIEFSHYFNYGIPFILV